MAAGNSVASWFETAQVRLLTMRIVLTARPLRVVQHLERFLQLRRYRDVELLARRQARDEPFVVEQDQVAVRAELAEVRSTTAASCGSPLRNMMP
jgi:hypothetical protein